MTSRKRKSKARILLALGKGIASSLATELAMLFCHAGCEVKIALIDNGHEWISESAIHQISGSAALTAIHRPGWFFAPADFALAMVISPASLTQQLLQARLTTDPVLEFILQKSPTLWILQDKSLVPRNYQDHDPRLIFRSLPISVQQLSPFFQQIFAETTAWLASRKRVGKKTFWLEYQVPEPLKTIANLRPDWLNRFDQALSACGLSQSSTAETADLVINAYDGPGIDADNRLVFSEPELPEQTKLKSGAIQVVFIAPELELDKFAANRHRLLAQRQNNSLHIVDQHGTRVIPDVTGQCCFARFSSQLIGRLDHSVEQKKST